MIVGFAVLGLSMGCLGAGQDEPKSGGGPVGDARAKPARARPTTGKAEAAKRSSGDPAVDQILDRLEVKGQAIQGLGCALTYRFVTVEPVADEQRKDGELLFRRDEPNSKFLIHFGSCRNKSGGCINHYICRCLSSRD